MVVVARTTFGLTGDEVSASRLRHGSNALPPPPVESFWDKLKDNFDDPLIRILCVALGITMVLAGVGYADWTEGLGIAVAVAVATVVATYSEHRNESSFQELQARASRVSVSVFREPNGVVSVPIDEVVVGDAVFLQAGDLVPSDGVVISGGLRVSQQSLTGEPGSGRKVCVAREEAAGIGLSLNDERCVFRGSMVTEGEGVVLVRAVGTATVYGKAAEDMSAETGRLAPLQVKLGHLADVIARLGYVGAISIAVSFLFKQIVMDNGWSFAGSMAYLSNWQVAFHDVVTSLILAIIIVVVAVPEGLPMMIAIVLSLNMRKLLARNVLVRRLIGIETAGSMDLLLVDKTGTLTHGTFVPGLVLGPADGARYGTYGELPSSLQDAFAFVVQFGTSAMVSVPSGGRPTIAGGNPTDQALLRFLPDSVLVASAGLASAGGVHVEDQVLFASEHKFSATQVSATDQVIETFGLEDLPEHVESVTLIKGASEIVVASCTHVLSGVGQVVPLSELQRTRLIQDVLANAQEGMRFLALAVSTTRVSQGFVGSSPESVPMIPPGAVLVAVVGLTDTVRPEAEGAIAMAERAGIQVVMITGDRLETALGVARSVGLVGDRVGDDATLTSEQLGELTDRQLCELLPRLRVVARALPSDKSRLVRVGQSATRRLDGSEPVGLPARLSEWVPALLLGTTASSGSVADAESGLGGSAVGGVSQRVVGMSGDGINDTAALKLADVSFAMGSGSEIAKEASDIVVLDDNIQSILNATLFGRTIYRSILKFIVFQSTINVASTVIVFVGPFCGFDFPLTLIQLLWVNMVMDSLSALAFGGEPALDTYMDAAPISRTAPIVNADMAASFLVNGVFIALYSIAFLVWDPILGMFSRVAALANTADGAASTTTGGAPDATARVQTPAEIAARGGPVFLTAFFSFFIFICTINAFNVRVPHTRLLEHISKNRGFLLIIPLILVVQVVFTLAFGSVLRVVPLTLDEWATVLAMATLIVPFDVMRKRVRGQA